LVAATLDDSEQRWQLAAECFELHVQLAVHRKANHAHFELPLHFQSESVGSRQKLFATASATLL